MSAEGRKKRGEAGASNAKTSPFRSNGLAPDWQARRRGAHMVAAAISGGSTFLRGMIGGILVEKLGRGVVPQSIRFEHMFEHAVNRATHEVFEVD